MVRPTDGLLRPSGTDGYLPVSRHRGSSVLHPRRSEGFPMPEQRQPGARVGQAAPSGPERWGTASLTTVREHGSSMSAIGDHRTVSGRTSPNVRCLRARSPSNGRRTLTGAAHPTHRTAFDPRTGPDQTVRTLTTTLVELRGIEPLTYSMRTSRATNCATAPVPRWGTRKP